MLQPCLSGRDTSKPRARDGLSPWHPILQLMASWYATSSLISSSTALRLRTLQFLAAEITLAAMCAGSVGCSGCERERQYATHSWVMTRRRSFCHRLFKSAASCQGPRLSSARRRSACGGGAGCWLTAAHVAANHCPDRMRDWAAEHDMAESGKLSLAGCMGAKV